MKYFDLCVRSGEKEVQETAKKFGFSGIGIILPEKNLDSESTGVELKDSKKAVKFRGMYVVAVSSQDPAVARKAMENSRVDIIFCKEANHVMIKIARKNNVAIGFDFSELLHTFGRNRVEILSQYEALAKLVRKYKVPFVLTSGARSRWDLRSPSDLEAFGRLIGLPNPREGLSDRILKENRKRLSKSWVIPGVEKVQ